MSTRHAFTRNSLDNAVQKWSHINIVEAMSQTSQLSKSRQGTTMMCVECKNSTHIGNLLSDCHQQ